ncbi:hypothetical protein JHK84_048002 [Glycine max]|nr:hypothetical protein JHK85_048584 [Glycine max]KAG5103033.1 hypothetical protein JHK84_048002 [Glycine max]
MAAYLKRLKAVKSSKNLQHQTTCFNNNLDLFIPNVDKFICSLLRVRLPNLSRTLKSLVISSNIVQGSIPYELVSLKILTVLDLSHNKINATLPIYLTNLTKLQKLDISHNLFGSRFPKTLVKSCMANQHSTSVKTSSAAHALSYLHHDCTPPIVHRDISTSNVLVNLEWEHCYICPTLNVYFAGKKKKARNQMP